LPGAGVVSRRLTREQISALFFGRWEKGKKTGDKDALEDALELIYEAGRRSLSQAVIGDRIERRSRLPKDLIEARVAEVRQAARPTLEAVADRRRVRMSMLTSTAIRDRAITKVRYEAAWILREQGLTYEHVAAAIGWTDHTCAIDGWERTEKRIAAGEVTRDELLAIAGGAQARRAA
jgi:hypothetical protein